jgi:hypothetical protein
MGDLTDKNLARWLVMHQQARDAVSMPAMQCKAAGGMM